MDYNELGLITNVVGAILLFIFGSPFKLTSDYGILYGSPTKKEKIKDKIVNSLSSLGMLFVFIGFGLQFYYHNNSNLNSQLRSDNSQLLPKTNFILTLILMVLIVLALLRNKEI